MTIKTIQSSIFWRALVRSLAVPPCTVRAQPRLPSHIRHAMTGGPTIRIASCSPNGAAPGLIMSKLLVNYPKRTPSSSAEVGYAVIYELCFADAGCIFTYHRKSFQPYANDICAPWRTFDSFTD